MLRGLIVSIFLYFIVKQVSAYTVFNIDNSHFSEERPTEVFILGYGGDLGDQFLRTAVTRAMRHKELNPSYQQLIIMAREKSKGKDIAKIQSFGFSPYSASNGGLTPAAVFNILKRLRSIKSIHIISHNAALSGAGLQKNIRLNHDHEGWNEIRHKLDNAYIFIHGCNTGFVFAPKLSEKLQIPVFGSLGSTDFQQLHNNGSWYHNNKGQYPAGGWASRNMNNNSCYKGHCHRLQPDIYHYSGYWGSYGTGLPFFKAFCAFNTNEKGMAKCNAALIQSLKSWPSTENEKLDNWASIERKLIDFLCPIHATKSVRENCLEVLNDYRNGQKSYATTFYGNDANCYLSGCDLTIKKISIRRSFKKVWGFFTDDNKNETLVREYQLYRDAFSGVTKRRVPKAQVVVEK